MKKGIDGVVQYDVTGMDCASDAAEIETAVRAIAGVVSVRVSSASQILTLNVVDPAIQLPEVERAISEIGYQLKSLHSETLSPGDDGPKDLSHISPAYKRALAIVVLLNIGYGSVELVGGMVSGSQALKADALDFLGDGLITFLGFLAIGWSLRWRARAALIQGLFLGALGIAVLVTTAYRVVVLNEPDAQLMGVFGLIALLVNVLAAVVLIPHRTGDANVRAVWLFSRNDAIGNAAVVVAALFVAWTGSPLPDLVVATVIAGLFLQSAFAIVRDARTDLRESH